MKVNRITSALLLLAVVVLVLPLASPHEENDYLSDSSKEEERLFEAVPITMSNFRTDCVWGRSYGSWGAVLLNSSIEEAEKFLPFSIALPSVLPLGAVLDGVMVSRWSLDSIDSQTGFVIEESRDVLWHIVLRQQAVEHWLWARGSEPDVALDEWYGHLSDALSDTHVTVRTKVGDVNAVLSTSDLDTLQGIIEPMDCNYRVAWNLFWHDGFFGYTLQGALPVSHVDYRTLVDIAKSVS